MKLGTNWWAREAWSIGPTIDSYLRQSNSLSSIGRRRNMPRSIMAWKKLPTNNIATQPKNAWGHFQRFGRGWKALFLPAPSIIQIIQAFFSSTTCTCASNWNLAPQKQPASTMNNIQQYRHETTLHPLENCIFKQNWMEPSIKTIMEKIQSSHIPHQQQQ